MTERELQRGVIDVARLLGYRVAHFRPALTGRGWRTPVQADGTGFPDLVLCGRGQVLFRELKVRGNTLTAEQAAWLTELRSAGADVGVWTDADWFAGLIEADLRRPWEQAA